MVEAAVIRMEGAITSIAEALKVLSRIDVQQQTTAEAVGRSFAETDSLVRKMDEHVKDNELKFSKIDDRLASVDVEMPGLKEMRRWAVTGIVAVLGMLGTSLVLLVLKVPH